jgi:uncharacterized ion transporter superfamily protein YfcC
MGIGMDKWYKFITPLFGMMFLLQAVLIVAGGRPGACSRSGEEKQ